MALVDLGSIKSTLTLDVKPFLQQLARAQGQATKINGSFATLSTNGSQAMRNVGNASQRTAQELQNIAGQKLFPKAFGTQAQHAATVARMIDTRKVTRTLGSRLRDLGPAAMAGFGRIKGEALQVVSALKPIGAKVGALAGAFFSLKAAVVSWLGAMAIGKIIDAAGKMESLRTSLDNIMGSAKAGAEEYSFLRAETDRLGISLMGASRSYKNLLAATVSAGMSSETARIVFVGFSEALRALGSRGQSVQLALRAVSQIMAKGKMTAEELRQQLGEQAPMAIGEMEKALRSMGENRSLDELMQKGLLTRDSLVLLAIQLHETYKKGAGDAAHSAQAEMARFKTSVDLLFVALGKAGLMDIVVMVTKALTRLADTVANNAEGFRFFFDIIGAGISFIIDLIGWIGKLGAAITNHIQVKQLAAVRAELERMQTTTAAKGSGIFGFFKVDEAAWQQRVKDLQEQEAKLVEVLKGPKVEGEKPKWVFPEGDALAKLKAGLKPVGGGDSDTAAKKAKKELDAWKAAQKEAYNLAIQQVDATYQHRIAMAQKEGEIRIAQLKTTGATEEKITAAELETRQQVLALQREQIEAQLILADAALIAAEANGKDVQAAQDKALALQRELELLGLEDQLAIIPPEKGVEEGNAFGQAFTSAFKTAMRGGLLADGGLQTLLQNFGSGILEGLMSKLTTDLSKSLDTMFSKLGSKLSFGLQLAVGVALMAVSSLFNQQKAEVESLGQQAQDGIESIEQTRGLIAGQQNIAIQQLSTTIGEAFRPTNEILLRIEELIRFGGLPIGMTSDSNPLSLDSVAKDVIGAQRVGA